MAKEDEKPDEGTPPEGTPPEGTPPGGTPPEEEPVDYKKRYKDLQAETTRVSQHNTELAQRLEQLEQPPEPDEDLGLDDDGNFVDKKTVSKMVNQAVSQAVSQVRTQSANAYFRRTYSDLGKYESVIAGLMRNPKEPSKLKGASAEERIDAAVKEFQDLTDEAKATAKAEAETEAKEREEANRKASGLTSSSTTSPKGGEEELSDEDELKARKNRQAKKRGLI